MDGRTAPMSKADVPEKSMLRTVEQDTHIEPLCLVSWIQKQHKG